MGVILLKHRRGSLQENSRFRDFSDFRGRYPAVGGKASSLNALFAWPFGEASRRRCELGQAPRPVPSDPRKLIGLRNNFLYLHVPSMRQYVIDGYACASDL